MTFQYHDFTPAGCEPATLSEQAATTRLSLRADEAERARLGKALGLELPAKVGMRTTFADREALCLGPDEWLIVAPEGAQSSIVAELTGDYQNAPHALAVISDREVSYRISGPYSLDLLEMGCPRNVAAIPVGTAARTVFDGATIILWRDAVDSFRLDVWRSFAPYVRELLETGLRELRTGL